MTTAPPGPENDEENRQDDSQHDDRPSGISHITTPAELDGVDSVDLERLLFGLEARTSCCLQVVPYDCLTGTCGHGGHEFRAPTPAGSGEPESREEEQGEDEQWEQRDDVPCVLYAPEPVINVNYFCRSRSQTVSEADDLWEKEASRTRQRPL